MSGDDVNTDPESNRRLQDGISPTQPEDFDRVVEVWEASVRATHDFVSEPDIQTFKPLVRAGLPQVETLACMRDADGQVVGFIGVENGEIQSLFIHPDWRGKGIGRKLLTWAVETRGATTLDVNEQNEQAIGFYRRMGFEVVGRSPVDGMGKPYPLLHMRKAGVAES
jgi:putative acetyltransferase